MSKYARMTRAAAGMVKRALNERASTEERKLLAWDIAAQLVSSVAQTFLEYRKHGPIEVRYDPGLTTWANVHQLILCANEVGKAGPVAQYLVGAKLALRFPDSEVSNERFSAADAPSGRLGDFAVGDTVIHVTVSPTPALYRKCERNIAEGSRVYLLVPDTFLLGARQNAEGAAAGKIAVESLESFLSQNLEEMSCFSKDKRISGFRRLLETYNARVDAIETDKSLMIEIPRALV